MAKRNRGTHEVCEGVSTSSAGGPLHLSKNACGCKKDPHHQFYVPFDQFDPNSKGRPDFWDGDPEAPYPFADQKGKWFPTAGSGCVSYVMGPFPGKCEMKNCPTCTYSEPKDISDHYVIGIETVGHVVNNQEEASLCEITFHDDFANPNTNPHKKVFNGADVDLMETDKDGCTLLLYTHDKEFASNLQKLCEKRDNLRVELTKKLEKFGDNSTQWVAVIAHPHACMKYITIGQYSGKDEYKFIHYTAKTCSGSSGGLVLPLGLLKPDGLVFYPHSAALDFTTSMSADWWWTWQGI